MRIFITGIPTSGKTYLAEKVAKKIGGQVYSIDNIREEISKKDKSVAKWVNFYSNQDEEKYYTSTTSEEQWKNLVDQSEAMWPYVLEKINTHDSGGKPVVFEGVNILPHLAKKDLSFIGIVLIGKSVEDVFDRIKNDHRWGKSEKLWRLEANSFFNVERPHYREEAEKYGYSAFEDSEQAEKHLLDLMKTRF